jgi:hypothetical protein
VIVFKVESRRLMFRIVYQFLIIVHRFRWN